MHEPGSARAALTLYKKGYKRVVAIRGGLYTMRGCGFKYYDNKKGIVYRDLSGKLRAVGE